MTLSFWVILALTFFFLGLQGEKKSRFFYLIPYVVMGVGVLTKGPVGFLLPFLTMVVYLLATKNFRHFKKLEIPWGLLVFILIISAWIVPACTRGGYAYTHQILFKQNIQRFANAWTREQPFYYYLSTFPEGFTIWTLLLPGALLWGFSQAQKERRSQFLFPLCWFLTIFIFFSLSTSKRELYLLPLFPAAAIVVGAFVSHFISTAERDCIPFKSLILPLYILGALFIIGGIGCGIFPFIKSPVSEMFRFFPYFFLLVLTFVIGGYELISNARKKNVLISFLFIIIIMVVNCLAAIEVILPKINSLKSFKPMCQSIIRYLPKEKKLVAYRTKVAPFNFYTGLSKIKELATIDELKLSFNDPSIALILLEEEDFQQLQKKSLIPMNIQVAEKDKIGHGRFVLLAKKT